MDIEHSFRQVLEKLVILVDLWLASVLTLINLTKKGEIASITLE